MGTRFVAALGSGRRWQIAAFKRLPNISIDISTLNSSRLCTITTILQKRHHYISSMHGECRKHTDKDKLNFFCANISCFIKWNVVEGTFVCGLLEAIAASVTRQQASLSGMGEATVTTLNSSIIILVVHT